jgi:hypothetical protein
MDAAPDRSSNFQDPVPTGGAFSLGAGRRGGAGGRGRIRHGDFVSCIDSAYSGLGPGVNLFEPSIGFADRISLFAGRAASLTVALLVVVAVMVVAMAVDWDGESGGPVRHWSVLLGATTAIGSIVVLANVAQAIVILSNSTVALPIPGSANKVSSILSLLPATLSATAALLYAVTRLRAFGDESPPTGG